MLLLSSGLLSPTGLFQLRHLRRKNLLSLAPFLAIPSVVEGLAVSSVPKSLILRLTETADPTMAAYDWCCTASINPKTDAIDIHPIVGDDTSTAITTFGDRSFDLTSNAEWMEYIENSEDRGDVEGGAGAYDVMRCDLAYSISEDLHPMKPTWRVWGEDYHLTRLVASYRSLLESMDDNASTSDEDIEEALTTSRAVIRALLMEAHSSGIMQSCAPPQESEVHDTTIQLVKLTILWTPKPKNKDGNQDNIIRGHACSSCKPVQIHKRPSPIIATIALPLESKTVSETKAEPVLPSRFRSPQNKVASWCRLRRPLEDPETYKPQGVGEVLMVRTTSMGKIEILEGLTSNFFVIYKDGTLRTADKGVLFGYVRHLVIDCAERVGLRMDFSPILLEDATQDLWESAFITSSSRLIYPISRILIPQIEADDASGDGSKGGVTFCDFWKDPTLVDSNNQASSPRWLDLLNKLLKEGGYETMPKV